MWAIPNYCHGMKCHKLLFLSSWRSYFTAFTGSMAAARSNDYEKAVAALNGLQTNSELLAEIRKQSKGRSEFMFSLTGEFLNRAGINVGDLDGLNIIHVAGTKGKGSVCAMCESILRAHGLKTGFYSSPHLVEVRERIRINGQPLSKDSFVTYFWQCYELLAKEKDKYYEPMPSYFRFLTLMAFKVFLAEKVDVAVVEVGLGGTYDTTNIIRQPKVCGISSLGYDHMDVLGNTLREITWHKSGICKEGVPLFVSSQAPEALEVILSRSLELKASSVHIAPPSDTYFDTIKDVGIAGNHQLENASLAVQLCRQWMKEMGTWKEVSCHGNGGCHGDLSGETNEIPIASPFVLPKEFIEGLKDCHWPGRCQMVRHGGMSYYLDGAHTMQSLQECAKWFQEASCNEAIHVQGLVVRLLLFNYSGKRDPEKLMSKVIDLGFDHVLFCPNVIEWNTDNTDLTNYNASTTEIIQRCHSNEEVWLRLAGRAEGGETPTRATSTKVFVSISEALEWVKKLKESNKEGIYLQLLACGSLHLVGGVMKVLGYSAEKI